MTDPSAASISISDAPFEYPPQREVIVSATGAQLANRISLIGAALEQNQIPAAIGRDLARALDKVQARLARRSALAQLQTLLDPQRQQSSWWLACELERRLRAFQNAGVQRVRNGYRPPDEIETNLLVLIDSGPQSAYRIWLELQDLTLHR